MSGEGCKQCESVRDLDAVISEFRHICMCANHDSALSLATLVVELKKQDIENLWIVGRNYVNIVKILLTLIPTSISSERSFLALDRVKKS